ncbi:MAG: hypothetical protein ACP5GZ_08995 [Vulcanisaeta sp.]|jgi:hypothetical protein|uniref:hypothetical protein n=1 Tax=Vulcanisaeta sp. TaxID=2020871 RepID=UPI003D146C28
MSNDLRNYWTSALGNEVAELTREITSGRARVIINRTSKTLAVHVYKNHVGLSINKIRNNDKSITIQLRLKGLNGLKIQIPNIFRETMNN